MESEDLYWCAKQHRQCIDVLLTAIDEIREVPKDLFQKATVEEVAHNETVDSLRKECDRLVKNEARLKRTIANLHDVIRTYQKQHAETAENLGVRCSQINHLAKENRELKNTIEALRSSSIPRHEPVSVIIPTADPKRGVQAPLHRGLELPKTGKEMENLGISASPEAVNEIAKVVKKSAFKERIREVFENGAVIPFNFVIHSEFAIPYVTFGDGTQSQGITEILSDWVMADPKHRMPHNFDYQRGGHLVATNGDSPSYWRLAYQFGDSQMMFFLASEYQEVINRFCDWYNNV